jgi:hypothetical protein
VETIKKTDLRYFLTEKQSFGTSQACNVQFIYFARIYVYKFKISTLCDILNLIRAKIISLK